MTDKTNYREAHARIDELKKLPDNWDSYAAAPPNDKAECNARLIINALERHNMDLDGISPDAEGGLGLYWNRSHAYADIECYNDGNVLGLSSDRKGTINVWYVSDLHTSSDNDEPMTKLMTLDKTLQYISKHIYGEKGN
jgi:hypothetical protein